MAIKIKLMKEKLANFSGKYLPRVNYNFKANILNSVRVHKNCRLYMNK